jgi:hypothetical protein
VTLPALLARGRAAAEMLMLDTVVVERLAGRVFNTTSGEYADTWATIYAGKADLRPQRMPREFDASQTATTVDRYDVKLPFAAAGAVKKEDRITATASGDPRLVGRPLVVTAVGLGTRRTAWHVTAVDQEQP